MANDTTVEAIAKALGLSVEDLMAKVEKKETHKTWINKFGAEVPEGMVTRDDKLRDEVVNKIINKARKGERLIAKFKESVYGDIEEYMKRLRTECGLDAMKDSRKGNVALMSFNGKRKVQIRIQESIQFNEKLTLAKEKIDLYLNEITSEANDEIKFFIKSVFDDKNDNIDVKRVIGLKKLAIKHPLFIDAMKLVDEATEVGGSKQYIQFYEKQGAEDKWESILLNFSK